MPLENSTNKILYVPFSGDYIVTDEIKKKLNEEEFFKKCFLHPKYEDYNEIIIDNLEEAGEGIDAQEHYAYIDEQDSSYKAFVEWINNSEGAVFIIKGDAGSGKTTYLNYLKYDRKMSNEMWCVIDLKTAVEEISFGNSSLRIDDFNTLYAKAFSAIILYIKGILKISQKCYADESFSQIFKIQNKYIKYSENYDILDDIDIFFSGFSYANDLINKDVTNFSAREKSNIVKEYKKYWFSCFSNLLHKYSYKNSLSILIKLLVILLKCNSNRKAFISFDNFERFIGTYEIFCSELVEFVDDVRHINDAIIADFTNFGENVKFLVLMRNTSSRMLISQQIADFSPHEIDITDWFSSKSIVEKKINWYKENNIEIHDVERIEQVLSDFGSFKNEFYGLRPKLDMLFNYNKRIIIEYLVKTFSAHHNKKYIELYDYYWKRNISLPLYLRKFAARTIITRLIYNQLRSDGLFKNIIAQRENANTSSKGYARQILTILHNYRLDYINDPNRITRVSQNVYMKFNDLIINLFPNCQNAVQLYFSDENKRRRKTITKALFYMNYYNRRSGNWLQFIDIQYNNCTHSINISNESDLFSFIDKNHEDINIRITNSGIAYLTYIVQSFEYFSSKYFDLNNGIDFPPLLCCIPSIDDLKNKKIDDLECIVIMRAVSKEAIHCINQMENNTSNRIILYKKKRFENGLTHTQRIINYHKGYLSNFIECCDRSLVPEIGGDENLAKIYHEFIKEIRRISKLYK